MTPKRIITPGTAQSEKEFSPLSSQLSAGADPRLGLDFAPTFYPLADGRPAPAGQPRKRDDAIRIEFCNIYYHLNRLQARLAELRGNAQMRGVEAERQLMQEIEKYLQARDALEDKHAPYGVIAEPILREGFSIDIKFTFGDDNILRRQRTQLVSSSALILFGSKGEAVSAFMGTTL